MDWALWELTTRASYSKISLGINPMLMLYSLSSRLNVMTATNPQSVLHSISSVILHGPVDRVSMLVYKLNQNFNAHILALQLEDLFVKSEYRNYGVGKALFRVLGKVAQEEVIWLAFFVFTKF